MKKNIFEEKPEMKKKMKKNIFEENPQMKKQHKRRKLT